MNHHCVTRIPHVSQNLTNRGAILASAHLVGVQTYEFLDASRDNSTSIDHLLGEVRNPSLEGVPAP